MRLSHKLPLIVAVTVLTIMVTQPIMLVTSQTESLEPGFGEAIAALQQAEAAGATPRELSQLVALLNTALELNRKALTLTSPDQAEERAGLLARVNLILAAVQNRAVDLRATASERTSSSRILTYVWGAVAAILGTICCAFALSIYQRYRIKRTFQMKVTLK